ncbi:MAG: chorismate synthase [Bdellovibrionales bacterium]
MSANSFGSRFVITTFGESHGAALGVVIDGCPSGLTWNQDLILKNLSRRRPGTSSVVSGRQESDQFEILSGVFEGKTLGTPIAMIVRNQDARSQDYDQIKSNPRAGHADDVWKEKFGYSDHRGGGRSSGRETVCRVLAGSVAQMLVQAWVPKLEVQATVVQIGSETVQGPPYTPEVLARLEKAQKEGESFGGVIEVRVKNPSRSLGQPVFHKLKSDLAAAYMSIGAVSAVELGAGIESLHKKGTEFHSESASSNYGGIRGGLSTGEDILFRVHVKPTSSLLDVAKKGRHDPFIGTRAVPVVESMSYLVLADHLLWKRTDRLEE